MKAKQIYIPDSYEVFAQLIMETEWVQDHYSDGSIGKPSAYYGEKDIAYDIIVHKAKPMTPFLRSIKDYVEHNVAEEYPEGFDAVYLNLYRDGTDVIRKHKDAGNGSIYAVSLSFGANRTFWWTDQHGNDCSIVLGHCDLMTGDVINLEHWLAPEPEVLTPRVNLTFRKMGEIVPGSFTATPEQLVTNR